MNSDQIDEILNGLSDPFKEINDYSGKTMGMFQNILSLAGATNSEFAQILNMVMSMLNTGSSIFDFFSMFIPGASVLSGLAGGGGSILASAAGSVNPMAGGFGGGARVINNQPIIIQGTLDGQKFLKKNYGKFITNRNGNIL